MILTSPTLHNTIFSIQLLSDLLLPFSLSLIPISTIFFLGFLLGFFNPFSLWGFFSLPAMTEVLHLPSSPRSSALSNDGFFQAQAAGSAGLGADGRSRVAAAEGERVKHREQLSLLALLVTVFRKSWVACKTDREELCAMEIGWPTNVRHVAHVTFDRFNGFLGLPVEFEPEVPRRAPSASANVFGVSTESMQLSFDSRGNSVPTILLLMQNCLYVQGGLQAEGIFRINAENSQEEYVREQLNRGVVPEGIDVHCLAGLIKAWFRELPTGVLDSLSPEQVMQCQAEEECAELVRLLPPTEAALLDWAINLMADVVQEEHLNKMNARNIAMVFAPNMTQMADPLTALMYAVQVMNFLKTLIIKTLREREDSMVELAPTSSLEPFDENGHQSPSQPTWLENTAQDNEETEQAFIMEEPVLESPPYFTQNKHVKDREARSFLTSLEKLLPDMNGSFETLTQVETFITETEAPSSVCEQGPLEKTKGISNLSRINSRTERIEAWR